MSFVMSDSKDVLRAYIKPAGALSRYSLNTSFWCQVTLKTKAGKHKITPVFPKGVTAQEKLHVLRFVITISNLRLKYSHVSISLGAFYYIHEGNGKV